MMNDRSNCRQLSVATPSPYQTNEIAYEVDESEIRQRKQKALKSTPRNTDDAKYMHHSSKAPVPVPVPSPRHDKPNANYKKQIKSNTSNPIVWKRFMYPLNKIIGLIVMIIASYKVAVYLELLHENELWFTQIGNIEREISFRTEQGLYYSYYKQLLNAPTLQSGLQALIMDNTTEMGRTINILFKFSVYQEVILSAIYRVFHLQKYIEPIFFYIKTVFFLHGVYMSALYLTAWMLSGSWLGGALTICFYIFNRSDATRVNYTIPLRESFSIPFLFCQMAVITFHLKPHLSKKEDNWSLFGATIFTFLYCLTWQFSPFIMLLQAITLFSLGVVSFAPKMKIIKLLVVHLASLLLVSILQFGQPLILGSLVLSFLPSAILILSVQENYPCRGMLTNIGRVVFRGLFAIIITLTTNIFMKTLFNVQSDEHIFKFAKAKLGLENPRDFETRIYLCHGSFQLLDVATYQHLSQGLVLPAYAVVEFSYLAALVVAVLFKWGNLLNRKEDGLEHPLLMENRPDLAYHVVITTFLALMAVSTLRMKCLWIPHMCILASVGIVDSRLWRSSIGWMTSHINCARHIAATLVMATLVYRSLPAMLEELNELKEFWDPDTVELMEWIKHETPKSSAFAGSMQLLAGVKLCTERAITNHPHFEDKWLRERTKQVYQIYARQPPSVVYSILKNLGTTHVILEDSICLASSRDRCRLPDLMDLHNGHVPDDGHQEPGLIFTPVPRFCDQVRYGEDNYAKYFQLVFINKTFRVYKLT